MPFHDYTVHFLRFGVVAQTECRAIPTKATVTEVPRVSHGTSRRAGFFAETASSHSTNLGTFDVSERSPGHAHDDDKGFFRHGGTVHGSRNGNTSSVEFWTVTARV